MQIDLDTTIQAAALFLANTPSERMSYLRLLKLLYLADRQMLEQTGRPITFDRAVAMKHGPVLSEVYDLIKGQHVEAGKWQRYIGTEGYHAVLKQPCERGLLSKRAIAVINEIQDRVSHLDDWALVDQLHSELPEWEANRPEPDGQNPIPLSAILETVGFSQEDAKEILAAINAERQLNLSQKSA